MLLYATVPTGFFPQQDTGFISGVVLTSQDASFQKLSQKIAAGRRRPQTGSGIAGFAFFAGGAGANQANISISLKPKDSGRKATADQVIARLRPKLARLVGRADLPAGRTRTSTSAAAPAGRSTSTPCPTPTSTS